MPDTAISALAEITAADIVDADLVDWVDRSDTTMAASGTNKRSTRAQAAIALARWKEIEVDFGSVPVSTRKWTITDAEVLPGFRIVVQPSGAPATGRPGNDWEVDAAQFTTVAGTGNFVLAATVLNGHIRGVRKILYQITKQ